MMTLCVIQDRVEYSAEQATIEEYLHVSSHHWIDVDERFSVYIVILSERPSKSLNVFSGGNNNGRCL